jgi:hypothetical protein
MTDTTTPRPHFSAHALTSMLTTGGFLVMTVTGLALFTIPAGRVANWVDWAMAGLTKEQWTAIHVTSSLLFVAAGLLHLWYNWGTFMGWLRRRLAGGHVQLRAEGPVTVVFLIGLVVGTLYEVPPFTWVLDLSASIKDSWSVDPAMEPPFGHAEEVTLKTLALRTATKADDIVAALKDAGWKVESANQTVRQVADANRSSPAKMWLEVQKRVPAAKPAAVDASTTIWTADSVEARFAGSGFGNKTVEQTATETGLAVDDVIARLTAAGIKATKTDRLKALAEPVKSTPTELLKLILVPGYKLTPQ